MIGGGPPAAQARNASASQSEAVTAVRRAGAGPPHWQRLGVRASSEPSPLRGPGQGPVTLAVCRSTALHWSQVAPGPGAGGPGPRPASSTCADGPGEPQAGTTCRAAGWLQTWSTRQRPEIRNAANLNQARGTLARQDLPLRPGPGGGPAAASESRSSSEAQ